MTSIRELAAEPYVSVSTFRKDGTAVATPVWAAPDGEALVIWTPVSAGKVKRIRNNPRVTLRACDLRGNARGGEAEGRAEILSAEETERVRALLRKKYGLQGRLVILGSRLRRGGRGTVGIRIAPAG
ncbi:PPOX class F420-dependent oxidoreductase [Planomonospora sp. ID67723]|uniref:PPOX class F420-dependent oxidoreductase n=1 Tax=Planomonospora sp. ID67723 TaxID=2738134 RepID=UPI0018C41B5F|nr:PPOX class F420-dependent oxidoreductase [Planomonospora sp. ID67723]MBG0832506.1 PPOX class F420-dependent oxidoreductase [Planomonospora sp. ID67723]